MINKYLDLSYSWCKEALVYGTCIYSTLAYVIPYTHTHIHTHTHTHTHTHIYIYIYIYIYICKCKDINNDYMPTDEWIGKSIMHTNSFIYTIWEGSYKSYSFAALRLHGDSLHLYFFISYHIIIVYSIYVVNNQYCNTFLNIKILLS